MTQKSPSNLVCLGTIVGVHGIKGSVRVKVHGENPLDFFSYGPLQDKTGRLYHLSLQSHPKDTLVIVKIDGITTRNQAEELRGVDLYIEHSQLPNLEDEEFYYVDLIGLVVVDLDGNDVGKIVNMHNFGAGDLLEIQDKNRESIFVSFTKEAVPAIDLKAKRVTLNTTFILDETPDK